MNKGDTVTVQDFRGRLLQRIVWDQFGTSIVVCTAGEYETWRQTGSEPKLAGFPHQEVKTLLEG